MREPEALEFCHEEVEAGRRTPAGCAALFPDIPDLEAQLHVAQRLGAWPAPTLSPQANRRIEARLRQPWQARRLTAPRRFGLAARWAAIPLLATLLFAGFGIVSAASSSLPGDSLYPIKRAGEAVQLSITPASARATLYATLAARRLNEISAAVSRDHVQANLLNLLLNDLKLDTEAAFSAEPDSPINQQAEVLNQLIREASRQQMVLHTIMPLVPPPAQDSLKQALQASITDQALAEERLRQINVVNVATETTALTPTPVATSMAPGLTGVPPGQTNVPPGQTHIPPGQTNVPPGRTQIPPGQTNVPPGRTQIPPGQTHVPPGQTNVPPGQTQIPPGQTQVPPGQTHEPRGQTHVPPGRTKVPLGQT
jgi:Domain of unknown function (DUF5667)